MEDNLNWRQPHWKMTFACLVSQFFTELSPAQPQIVFLFFQSNFKQLPAARRKSRIKSRLPLSLSSIEIIFHLYHLPLMSSSIEIVFHWGRLPLRWSSIKVVFNWGHLLSRSSSIEVDFHWGHLPLRLSHWGCSPLRSSSLEVVFRWGHLPYT